MSHRSETTSIGFIPGGGTIILFTLRLAIGGLMFEAGLDKFLHGFSSEGFLNASSGPFSGFYNSLASYANAWNILVPWAEVLIGIAVILGIFVRPAAFFGALEVLIFYLANLPPSSGWINNQIVYIVVFITLMLTGVGYIFGLDVLGIDFERRHHRFRLFLG